MQICGTSVPACCCLNDGRYVLSDLPYAYDALEPVYDAETVRLHHDKHHAAYVQGLNTVLDKLEKARETGNYADIKSLSKALAFHGSGHLLHTLFWRSMTPGGSEPTCVLLLRAIEAGFGSLETCKAQFAAASKEVEGSGWGILAYEPCACKLLILQAEKHQNLALWGVQPLLVCDVWEHAYYLKYQNRRAEWVDAFMTLLNWQFAAERFSQAKEICDVC